MGDVPQHLPGGSTNMVEGPLPRVGRGPSVPAGTQSGLRIIVLFTDGASNSVPAATAGRAGSAGAPDVGLPEQRPPIPTTRRTTSPHIERPVQHAGREPTSACHDVEPQHDAAVGTDAGMVPAHRSGCPRTSRHVHHRSAGIPTSFPLQTNTLNGGRARAERPRAV